MSAGVLAGKRAFVTGGSRGIGRAIAQRLIAEGARVTIAGRDRATLDEAARALGCEATNADVTDARELNAALAALGPLDVLVNNAGAALSKPFERHSDDDLAAMLAVNLTATFRTARAVLPGMRERGWGRVVNVASTAGLKGYAYAAAYCAAKHAAIGLTRALAVEFASSGVTINAVCPGFTDTDLTAGAVANIVAATGRSAAQARAALAEFNPQKRLVEPAEVADAVAFLCRPAAAAVTGQALVVAGGEVM
jgi:NAD(P)-dependent dehydrogenase (short-subunit alcohol dehydrogenase family)